LLYNFDAGLPDPAFYPVADLRHYYDQVLGGDGADACNYTSGLDRKDMVYGHHGLRAAMAAWLDINEGTRLAEENLLLANGSMNGISMAVNALVGPRDAVVVEAVSYPYARRFVEAAGGTVFTVPVDENGMDVDAVAERFARAEAAGLRPKLLYTVATFHSPTGTVLAGDRRERLVELARQFGVTVLDDNCYYHLFYDDGPPDSLLSFNDEQGPVVQSGSFSKYVAPGLRMAWLAGSADTIASIARHRQDFAVSQLTARVLEGYVGDGLLDKHLVDLRRLYRSKRDVAGAALDRYCTPLVRFRLPAGGIYFWLEVDERVDYDGALARAAELGVGFRPGAQFLNEDSGTRHLRLSVAQLPEADIEAGVALLGQALAQSATHRS
jgi:2-aminoadipate transaminase